VRDPEASPAPRFRSTRSIADGLTKVSDCAETAQVAGDRFRFLSGPGAHERFGDQAVVPICRVRRAGPRSLSPTSTRAGERRRTPRLGRKRERRTTRLDRDPDARFSEKRSYARDGASRGAIAVPLAWGSTRASTRVGYALSATNCAIMLR
jgi:hypothetical protein